MKPKDIQKTKKEILIQLKGDRELVINRCFGGFGLSNKAVLELVKMKSKLITKSSIKEYYGGNNPKFQKDWEEKFNKGKERHIPFADGFYVDKIYEGHLYKKEDVFFIDGNIEHRDNEDLIEVVRRLGKEANGNHAKLKIIKIPSDVEWEINDYDGIESVEEKHRSWN